MLFRVTYVSHAETEDMDVMDLHYTAAELSNFYDTIREEKLLSRQVVGIHEGKLSIEDHPIDEDAKTVSLVIGIEVEVENEQEAPPPPPRKTLNALVGMMIDARLRRRTPWEPSEWEEIS